MKLSDYIRCYVRKFTDYRIFTYAASASFFIITALMPLITLTLSILSLTPLGRQDFLDMVANALPEGFIQDTFYSITGDIVTTSVGVMSISVIISIVILLWSSSKSVIGLLDGLNAIAKAKDERGYFTKRVICILYMLIFIVGMIITLGLQVFANVYSQKALARLQNVMPRLASFLRMLVGIHKPVIFVVIALFLVIVYTVFPNKKMRLLMQIPGALFGAFAWLAFSDLYSIFVENFSNYPAVYGSLGVAVLAMIWLYFCISFVFIGAVINQLYPSVFWRVHVGLRYRFMLRRVESEESGRLLVRRYGKKRYRKRQQKARQEQLRRQQEWEQEKEKMRQAAQQLEQDTIVTDYPEAVLEPEQTLQPDSLQQPVPEEAAAEAGGDAPDEVSAEAAGDAPDEVPAEASEAAETTEPKSPEDEAAAPDIAADWSVYTT